MVTQKQMQRMATCCVCITVNVTLKFDANVDVGTDVEVTCV